MKSLTPMTDSEFWSNHIGHVIWAEKDAKFDQWLQEVAPSAELHQRFGQHPNIAKWTEFEQSYRAELQAKHKSIDFLHQKSKEGVLTLIHAAHDDDHSSAGVLKRFLEETANHADSRTADSGSNLVD